MAEVLTAVDSRCRREFWVQATAAKFWSASRSCFFGPNFETCQIVKYQYFRFHDLIINFHVYYSLTTHHHDAWHTVTMQL